MSIFASNIYQPTQQMETRGNLKFKRLYKGIKYAINVDEAECSVTHYRVFKIMSNTTFKKKNNFALKNNFPYILKIILNNFYHWR